MDEVLVRLKPILPFILIAAFYAYQWCLIATPQMSSGKDKITFTQVVEAKTVELLHKYCNQEKYFFTIIESYLAAITGVIVALENAKLFHLPITSDLTTLIIIIMEATSSIFLLIYIKFDCSFYILFVHGIVLFIVAVAFAVYVYKIRAKSNLDVILLAAFLILCIALNIFQVLVGFYTLNDPVQIDERKLMTQHYMMLLAIFHYINQYTKIVSLTVSTTVDASPFKAAKVTITVQKKWLLFKSFKRVSGIHSHKWTSGQVRNEASTFQNFESSINYFNTEIPNLLKIRIGDQATFDAKLVKIITSSTTQDNVPFLKDIVMACSIAFSKASAYCDDIPLYDYFLSFSGFKTIIHPLIIFNMIVNDDRKSLIKHLAIQPLISRSFETSIECARKAHKHLQRIFKHQFDIIFKSALTNNLPSSSQSQQATVTLPVYPPHPLIQSLSTPVRPDGYVLLRFTTMTEYWSILHDAVMSDTPKGPKAPTIRVYMETNAPSLWKKDHYEVEEFRPLNQNLLDLYHEWHTSHGLEYIMYPFYESAPIYRDKKSKTLNFVQPYHNIIDWLNLPKSINFISVGLDDCLTISNFIQTCSKLRCQYQKKIIITGSKYNLSETILADLACAVNANRIHFGGVHRCEYARLVEIESVGPYICIIILIIAVIFAVLFYSIPVG